MTDHDSKLPPPAYFEERAALALLVPRAKVLAALADVLGTVPTAGTVTVPRAPTAALLRPFISCPEAELPEAWEAMLRIAAIIAGRAVPPAAPGEIVKAIREYLGAHPELVLGGQVLDDMALELARIALSLPADRIGALALEELMQLGYTVEAGAILPPRDLPAQACEFFGVRPVTGPAPHAEARICSICDHIGISDASRTISACSQCEWHGDTPPDGKCPRCSAASAMTAACPKCSSRYILVASSQAAPGASHPTEDHPVAAPEAVAGPSDEREAFEAWARAKTDWKPNLERKGDGYVGAFAQAAWDGWCARGAAPQAPAAPVTPAAAMAALKAAFASDPEYAWSWHCGAWACAHDEGLDTGAANRAAARLMHMAFGCDTSKHPNFLDAHRTAAPAAPALSGAPVPVMPRAITAGLGLDDSGEEPAYCVMVAFREEDDARYALSILSAGLGATSAEARDAARWRAVTRDDGVEGAEVRVGGFVVMNDYAGQAVDALITKDPAAPTTGSWIAAEEVACLVRELDVALHGEADAAPQAALCDIVGLVKTAARQLGRPVLGAAAALASDTALLDAMTQHRIALVPENNGPWDAEVYGEIEATPAARGTGATPREALSAALAAIPAATAAISAAIQNQDRGAGCAMHS